MGVTVRGLDRVKQSFANPGPFFKAIRQEYADILAAEVQELSPRDTGRGVRQIRGVTPREHVEVKAPLYLAVLDQGRPAGARMPPSDALVGWVRRQQGRGRLRGANAYVIARSIGEKGIEARNFAAQALSNVKARGGLQQAVRKAMARHGR